MKKLSRNNQGFSVVEAILGLLVLVALAFGGWWVYDQNQNNNDSNKNESSRQTKESESGDGDGNGGSDDRFTPRSIEEADLPFILAQDNDWILDKADLLFDENSNRQYRAEYSRGSNSMFINYKEEVPGKGIIADLVLPLSIENGDFRVDTTSTDICDPDDNGSPYCDFGNSMLSIAMFRASEVGSPFIGITITDSEREDYSSSEIIELTSVVNELSLR